MTSFLINEHLNRKVHDEWKDDSPCSFCRIISKELSSLTVYETDKVIAILDILPLRPGHTLVFPKTHISNVSDQPPDIAAAMGMAVSKVASALTQALQNTALNVVCNQEYAQSVPHVHFHIIPAPKYADSRQPSQCNSSQTIGLHIKQSELHQLEYEGRSELDEQEGLELLHEIRSRL